MRAAIGLPRNVLLLAATSFFADVSSEMLRPVLPLFLTQQLGAPASVVGVVEGVAEGTQNAVQGVSGWLADRLRRNKPLALAGYGLGALAKPAIGLATAWPLVLVGRFGDRLGTGVRSAPRDALIADSVDEPRRGAAFGLEGIGDNLGAVVGPLLAAALLSLLHMELRWIFYLAVVPGALALAMVAFVSERRERERAPAAAAARPGIRDLPPAYWKYLLCVAAFGVGNSSNAFIVLKATDVGTAAGLTTLVYAAFNLVAAVVSYPVGRASDRWGRRPLFLAALAVFAVAYAGLALTSSALVVALLFLIYGAYQGTFRTVGKALATDLAPEALRASGLGLYAAALGLSSLLAGVVGGQLWDRVGPSATFLYGAACAVLGGLLLAVLVPSRAERRRA
jgi:MFS family permease